MPLAVRDTQRIASLTHGGPIGCQEGDVINRFIFLVIFSSPFAAIILPSDICACSDADEMHGAKLRIVLVQIQPNPLELEWRPKTNTKLQHLDVEALRGL